MYYNPESYGGRLETEVTRMRVFASSANMPPQDPEFGLLRKDPLPQEQYSSWSS